MLDTIERSLCLLAIGLDGEPAPDEIHRAAHTLYAQQRVYAKVTRVTNAITKRKEDVCLLLQRTEGRINQLLSLLPPEPPQSGPVFVEVGERFTVHGTYFAPLTPFASRSHQKPFL